MAENQNERLILFSDAVFSITITLLVLDIRLPGDVADLTDPEVWSAVLSVWPQFFAYCLSYLVIATFWFSHRRKFAAIVRRTPTLDWLNIVYLLTIGLVPFVTGVIAENGGVASTVIYAFVVALVSIIGVIISVYARRSGLSDNDDLLRYSAISSALSAGVFLASIPIAFADPTIGKLFWILLWPAGLLAQRIRRYAAPASA